MNVSNMLGVSNLSDDNGDDQLYQYQQEYQQHLQFLQQEYNEDEDEDYVIDEEEEEEDDEEEEEEEEEEEYEEEEGGEVVRETQGKEYNHRNQVDQRNYPTNSSLKDDEEEEEEEEEEEDYEEDLEALDDEEDEIQDLYEYEKYYNNSDYKQLLGQHHSQTTTPHNIDHQLLQEQLQQTPQSNQQQIINQQAIINQHNRRNLKSQLQRLNGESITTVTLSENDDEDDGDYEIEEGEEDDEDENEEYIQSMHNQSSGDEHQTLPEHYSIILNDGETMATLYPIYPANPGLLPQSLVQFLLDEFNMEIEKGDTLPFFEQLSLTDFKNEWFTSKRKLTSKFSDEFNPHEGLICVMILGEMRELEMSKIKTGIAKNKKLNNIQWEKQCLGAFNIKPAFPGRSSHICTSTFLVNAGIRGKGIGRIMVDRFLDWAPKLGYSLAQFPLVYETNVGMRKIFESSDFKQIGHLPNSGILKGYDTPVGSVFYYKELVVFDDQNPSATALASADVSKSSKLHMESQELPQYPHTANAFTNVSVNTGPQIIQQKKKISNETQSSDLGAPFVTPNTSVIKSTAKAPLRKWSKGVDADGNMERYTRIAYFLTTGSYPPSIDRQEKAKLRSSRSRYQLDGEGRLYMNGKEVIYNTTDQLDLVKKIHLLNHVGINKLTKLVNKDYYWPGIKNTVTDITKTCEICKTDSKKTMKHKKTVGRIVKAGRAPTKIYMGDSIPLKKLQINAPAKTLYHSQTEGYNNPHISGSMSTLPSFSKTSNMNNPVKYQHSPLVQQHHLNNADGHNSANM